LNSTSPAIVAQSAVRRLPRWALLGLCAAYVMAGFWGRGPWKNGDIAALGYMLELAGGHTPWLNPLLAGLPPETDGLLAYWLGAWAVMLAPAGWSPEVVTRLPFIGMLVLTLVATWYGVYYLARSPRAQPVAFAFGGEARPNDYARALAVSPTHLSRVARAATGVSAQRLIEARLMREARRNLAYTHLGVATIAYTLGYADPAYFTRAFTRDAGLSPRAFRAQVAASAPAPAV